MLSTLTVLNNFDNGAGSLRAEIAAAHNNDTVVFAPSLAGQTITLTSGELLIKQNVTIAGPSDRSVTVSGSNLSRVFEVAKGTKQVTLSGLTITGGLAQSGNGGGILNHGTLTVSNSTLSFNSVTYAVGDCGGGAIFNDNGTLTVSGCTVSDNRATVGGGGLFSDDAGTMTVTDSIISRNTAGNSGGGINNDGAMTVSGSTLNDNSAGEGGGIVTIGKVTVSGCTLSGNHAGGAGGGIANLAAGSRTGVVEGTLTVSGCTLSGNQANSGGGIYNQTGTNGSLTIIGSTLLGNSARYGGGIYVLCGRVAVSACTITANAATSRGGGIYVGSNGSLVGTVTVQNSSSITGNTAVAGFGPDVDNVGVLYLDSTSTIGILDGNPVTPI